MKRGHLRAADQLPRNARAGLLQSGKAQEREGRTVQPLRGGVKVGGAGELLCTALWHSSASRSGSGLCISQLAAGRLTRPA